MCRSTVWKQMLGQLLIALILTHCIKLLEHSFILMLMAEEVRNSAVIEFASKQTIWVFTWRIQSVTQYFVYVVWMKKDFVFLLHDSLKNKQECNYPFMILKHLPLLDFQPCKSPVLFIILELV